MDADTILSHVAFTTSGSLVDCVDKKVIIILRDGKNLIGVLRSYDQFANLVLQDTIERMFSGNRYFDIPRGLYLVRGENVVLLGEIDLDKEDDQSICAPVRPEAISMLMSARTAETEARIQAEKRKADVLRRKHGFCAEGERLPES
ncbi:hypothetical protein CBS101457_000460 [Exobasidium rhododendri]|nr:hypothetical protein CBS101457_000460 [Exobasidium rhododendri]